MRRCAWASRHRRMARTLPPASLGTQFWTKGTCFLFRLWHQSWNQSDPHKQEDNAYLSKLHNFQQGSIYPNEEQLVINHVHVGAFPSFHIHFLFPKPTLSVLMGNPVVDLCWSAAARAMRCTPLDGRPRAPHWPRHPQPLHSLQSPLLWGLKQQP